MPEVRKFLTVDEAVDYLGANPAVVERAVERGWLHLQKRPDGTYAIAQHSLEEWKNWFIWRDCTIIYRGQEVSGAFELTSVPPIAPPGHYYGHAQVCAFMEQLGLTPYRNVTLRDTLTGVTFQARAFNVAVRGAGAPPPVPEGENGANSTDRCYFAFVTDQDPRPRPLRGDGE